jgi:hypothetical protein
MSRSLTRRDENDKRGVNPPNMPDPRDQLAKLIGELLAQEWLKRQASK